VRKVTRGSVLRYRFMAYFTGVMLLLLCGSIYLQLGPPKNDGPEHVFGAIHGYGYLLYLITAADLAWRARWSLVKTVLVLLAGTIPFMSFVAEHIVVRDLNAAKLSAEPVQAPTAD
jgi:integral membrane protein